MQRDPEASRGTTGLEQLMRQAGDLSLAHFGSVKPETKQDSSLVTEADRLAEDVLVAGLHRLFPSDAIVSEEGGRVQGNSGRCWYVDPIDGTAAFVEGLAHWGPVVGCMDESGPVEGAVYMPRTGDFFWAQRGQGAWLNGRRLPVISSEAPTYQSVIYVPSRFHRYVQFDFQGKLRSLGGTAAHLALVASGSAVGAIVPAGWKLWDVVGPFCLLSEVGATALGMQDSELDLRNHPSQAFAVGHPSLVQAHFGPSQLTMRRRKQAP
ncbi:MAG: inositol monophosphatase family protein [Myxococcota bacterium]|nr:inositol monophosphatase family protein [Myxococcota bacterium]